MHVLKVPNDTSYRLQTTQPTSVGAVTAVTNCCVNCVETHRPQQWGSDLQFLASRPCRTAGWLALLLIKPGDVETNPGPTTTHKQVWICDICFKQIHGMKQISIRCNRIEHWVHLRCAGIRLAQYTDSRNCHLHKESGLTADTDIPRHLHALIQAPTLPHLHNLHHRNPNTDTRSTLPLFTQDW